MFLNFKRKFLEYSNLFKYSSASDCYPFKQILWLKAINKLDLKIAARIPFLDYLSGVFLLHLKFIWDKNS